MPKPAAEKKGAKISLRLRPDLRAWIERLARRSNRSMNAVIEDILSGAMRRKGTDHEDQ